MIRLRSKHRATGSQSSIKLWWYQHSGSFMLHANQMNIATFHQLFNRETGWAGRRRILSRPRRAPHWQSGHTRTIPNKTNSTSGWSGDNIAAASRIVLTGCARPRFPAIKYEISEIIQKEWPFVQKPLAPAPQNYHWQRHWYEWDSTPVLPYQPFHLGEFAEESNWTIQDQGQFGIIVTLDMSNPVKARCPAIHRPTTTTRSQDFSPPWRRLLKIHNAQRQLQPQNQQDIRIQISDTNGYGTTV